MRVVLKNSFIIHTPPEAKMQARERVPQVVWNIPEDNVTVTGPHHVHINYSRPTKTLSVILDGVCYLRIEETPDNITMETE